MKAANAPIILGLGLSLVLVLTACGEGGRVTTEPTPSATLEQRTAAPTSTATGGKLTATVASTYERATPTLVPVATATFAATATPEPTSGEEVVTPTASAEPTTESAYAEAGMEVTSEDVVNNFPGELVFHLSAHSEATIEEVTLHYQILPDGVMAYGRPDFAPVEHVETAFRLKTNDPPRTYVAPGTEIEYFWEVQDAAGNKLTTEPSRVFCLDIRFPWDSVSEGNVTVYWYAGSRSSAESSLEVARDTLDKMSVLLGVTVDYPVKVMIYDSYEDMLPALVGGSDGRARQVVAGERVASDAVLLQGEGAGDTLRHELTHIVTHVAGEGPYGSLPTWLDEGTAMYAQSEPGEGFTSALEKAVNSDSLLSVHSMSAPTGNPNQVALFYGQAWSLVNFLVGSYGPEKFAELFATFKEGSTVDNALLKVYGFDQDGLEAAWRISLGLSPQEPGGSD